MKFGKRLKIHLEEMLPEWRDKFVGYKRLKKQLKLLKNAPRGFAEGAFIDFSDAANSKVARVDRQLRDGSEIGHYGPPMDLQDIRNFPGVLLQGLQPEQQQQQAAAIGSSSSNAGGAAALEDDASDVDNDNDSTSSSSPTPSRDHFCQQELPSAALAVAVAATSSSSRSRKRKAPEPATPGDSDGDGDTSFDATRFSTNQMFINLLMMELKKFNHFFCEKEEEYVIRLQELKDRTESFKDRTAHKMHLSEEDAKERTTIYSDMITFHGEMVLLMNYSSLNYTGLVKILKKHDKQTGGVLRTPFIQYVLHQPFYTTELLSQLVSDCETNLSALFPLPAAQPAAAAALQPRCSTTNVEHAVDCSSAAAVDRETGSHRAHSPASSSGDHQGQQRQPSAHATATGLEDNLDGVYKGVVAALQTIKDIRRTSSTYTALSMPPLDLPDADDNSLGVVIDERVLRDSPPCRSAAVSVSQD